MDQSIVVAVASSAGDLDAVCELLSALPAASGAAFVIVQHPDPARREVSLGEALAKLTNRPVVVAHDGVVPERDHVYVMGANSILTIRDGRMRVNPSANAVHGPSDTLFTSVAEDLGADAIGVVLSGRGSDGALGIRAIKQAGGATFAQFPGSARFASMPISAIDTRCVDHVLRPNEIARELSHMSRFNSHPQTLPQSQPKVASTNRAQASAIQIR
ncbi:MAG TPA: chemotaxis protein CheB [Steroidobacteraceae bacterium]|nr:chemotaxis protein CheB [Steroidobacteraceae bacterium]